MPTLKISVTIIHTKMLRERSFALTKLDQQKNILQNITSLTTGIKIVQKQKECRKLWNCLHIRKIHEWSHVFNKTSCSKGTIAQRVMQRAKRWNREASKDDAIWWHHIEVQERHELHKSSYR